MWCISHIILVPSPIIVSFGPQLAHTGEVSTKASLIHRDSLLCNWFIVVPFTTFFFNEVPMGFVVKDPSFKMLNW